MNREKSVLLIGPNFHYFLHSMKRAFQHLGWDVHLCLYDNPIHPYNFVNKVRYKLAKNKSGLKESRKEKYQTEIISIFTDVKPQITLIINGDNLLPTTVEFFAKNSRVGIWLFDSVLRITDCLPNLPYAHAIFCYEREDIKIIKQKYDIDSYFLPQAVDLSIYNFVDLKKEWDIVFAGDIYHSTKRRILLPKVVDKFGDRKMIVWGIYKPWFKNPWLWLTRERKDIYKNCNTSSEQLNFDYNKSRIVLNVHHEQQKNGANPKVFEIAATQTYQICDANLYIEELFPNGEIGIYHNEQELFDLIDYALTYDMSEKAKAAYNIVTSQHTFIVRIKTILDKLSE